MHAGQEAHRYCVEHGLEEASAASGQVRALAATTPQVEGAEINQAHHGCAFAHFYQLASPVRWPALQAGPQLEVSSPSMPAWLAPVPSIAILRIAPKTSPPI